MYSTTLFIVDTSLSGFFGSGERHTSAVERQTLHVLVGHASGELDDLGEPELDAEGAQVLEGVPAPMNTQWKSWRTGGQVCQCAQRVVHAVLGAHDTEIGEQVRLASLQRGIRVTGHETVQVRTAPHHHDIGRVDLPSLDGHVTVALVGGDHPVRSGEGEALEDA